MRVGIAIPALHGGGAEVVLRHWTEGLSASGHSMFIYTYEPSPSVVELPQHVVYRQYMGRSRLARIRRLPAWLRRNAEEDELDVLVSMLTYTNLAAIIGLSLRSTKVPVVITEHNIPTLLLGAEGTSGRAKRSLARRLYRRADAAIGVSHAVAGDLLGGYLIPPDRLFVVPNPLLRLSLSDLEPTLPGSVHLVFVGRMVDQKRPHLFVDVLSELRDRGVRVRGTMIGDGPARRSVEAYARAKEVAVQMPGWCEPWWEGLDDVDCLVLPSIVEGFGNVLVEAAAAGIQAVARSPALGVADAIVPGITGELAAIGDTVDLADAVLRVVSRDAADGISGWLRHFSIDSSVMTLEGVLRHVRARHEAAGRLIACGGCPVG